MTDLAKTPETQAKKSKMTVTRIATGIYEVDADTTIEKRYGEWRIIDDVESYTLGFATLRDAKEWLAADLARKEGA